MILPDGVKWKFDGVVDSFPPKKNCEVLNGEWINEYWEKNDSKSFADSDDSYILLKWGVIIKCYEEGKKSKSSI